MGSERQPLLSALNPHAFAFTPGASSSAAVVDSPGDYEPPTPGSDWHQRRAHILSPHTREHSSRGGSESTFSSATPTRRTFRAIHALVQFPFSFVLCAGLLGGLIFWVHECRWVELGLGAMGWLASETVKEVLFTALRRETSTGEARLGIPTILHSGFQEVIRLFVIYVTVKVLPTEHRRHDSLLSMPMPPPPSSPSAPRRPLPPLDTLFFSALFIALGWAIVEILGGSRDFWRRIKLYDDVLEGEFGDEEAHEEEEASDFGGETAYESMPNSGTTPRSSALPSHMRYSTALYPEALDHGKGPEDGLQFLSASAFESIMDPLEREMLDAEVDAHVRTIEREEIEAQFGVALYEIPVVVVCIWRLDSLLLSVVLTLLLSLPFRTTSPSLFAFPLLETFVATTTLHVLIALLWVSRVRWVGIPAVSYTTLVLLLGALFAVLAAWGALA